MPSGRRRALRSVTELPWRRRVGIRPKTAFGNPRLVFKVAKRRIIRITLVPPSQSGPHQLLTQTAPIIQNHFSHCPAVPILSNWPHRDVLTENQVGDELLRALAKRLALLWGIYAVDAHPHAAPIIHDGDGVPVSHANHPIGKRAPTTRRGIIRSRSLAWWCDRVAYAVRAMIRRAGMPAMAPGAVG